jgi:UDP-glucose 4-epimerase
MKVLVTGAFGNIGTSAVRELIRQGHQVRCLVRRTRANERRAARYQGKIELAWGDVRQLDAVARAVASQDTIIHLASILPPRADDDPDDAFQVNVGGTRNLLAAAAALPRPPRILFSSSCAVFGFTQDQPPPRRVDDPIIGTDPYTRHKVACEELIQASGLESLIFRFADVPPLGFQRPHPIMFRIPLDTRIEVLHTADAGLALANAVSRPDVWGRILLIGGGASCQVHFREYVRDLLGAAGIPMLPDAAFGAQPYYTDWLDTVESERLLTYQRHSFADIVRDVAHALAPVRFVVSPFGPLARWWLLRLSPFWHARGRRPAD